MNVGDYLYINLFVYIMKGTYHNLKNKQTNKQTNTQ